jgi:hypothetical protein
VRDASGRIHGALPKGGVPRHWTQEQLQHGAQELRESIRARKAQQVRFGEEGVHRARIAEEEDLLRKIEKVLSGS